MKLSTLAMLSVAISQLLGVQALGCSCLESSESEDLARADVAVVGTVEAIDLVEHENGLIARLFRWVTSGPETSEDVERGRIGGYHYAELRVRLKVESVLKGNESRDAIFFTSAESSCGDTRFDVGGRFRVLARVQRDGVAWTNLCMGNVRLDGPSRH